MGLLLDVNLINYFRKSNQLLYIYKIYQNHNLNVPHDNY